MMSSAFFSRSEIPLGSNFPKLGRAGKGSSAGAGAGAGACDSGIWGMGFTLAWGIVEVSRELV